MKKAVVFAWPLLVLLAAGPTSPIRPGKWESSSTPIDIQLPNEPGTGLLKYIINRTVVGSRCITPTQAQTGVLALINPDEKCRLLRVNTTGGRIDGQISCPVSSGESTGTINGTYGIDRLDMTMFTTVDNPHRMSIKTHVLNHYVGPC